MQNYATALANEGTKVISLDPPLVPSSVSTPEVFPPNVEIPSVFGRIPHFRLIAMMLSLGKGPGEIAEALGLEEDKVSELVHHPGVSLALEQIPNGDWTALTRTVLGSSVFKTIQTLIEIRDNKEASPSARMQACKLLLDHALGSPEAKSKTNAVNPKGSTLPEDPVARQAALAKLIEERQKKLGVSATQEHQPDQAKS